MRDHGFVIERFEEIDSTNTYLMAAARRGEAGRRVAVADFQTAGRGRLDRRWEAPPRSALLVSFLLRARLDPEELHLVTAAVALAGAAAVARATGMRPGIKWPNDLVVEQGKLAGVLAEADPGAPGGGPGTIAVVVGMGINLTTSGPPGAGGTSVLEVTGVDVERDVLLDLVVDELGGRLDSLENEAGRHALLAELAASLSTIGRRVEVQLAGSSLVGTATGLGPNGHLVVEVDGRNVEVAAGDVIHLRPAAGGDEG